VQKCCKGDPLCQWNTSIFLNIQGSKLPEPIDIKLDGGDYVGDLTPTPHAKIGTFILNGGGAAYE